MDDESLLGPERIDLEVATERDLFNCHGTLYELPARNGSAEGKQAVVEVANGQTGWNN